MIVANILLMLVIGAAVCLGWYQGTRRALVACILGSLIIASSTWMVSIVHNQGFQAGAGHLRDETLLEEDMMYITGYYASLMDGGFMIEIINEKQDILWYRFSAMPPTIFIVERNSAGERVYVKKEIPLKNPKDKERLKRFRPKNTMT